MTFCFRGVSSSSVALIHLQSKLTCVVDNETRRMFDPAEDLSEDLDVELEFNPGTKRRWSVVSIEWEELEEWEEEVDEYKEVFELIDENEDGVITPKELGAAMRSMGESPTEEELQEMVKEVDANGNCTMEFSEFLTKMGKRKMSENPNKQDLYDAFRFFDRDGNGFISLAELRYVMTKMGQEIANEEFEQMIKEADLDGDGLVDYREFVKMLTGKEWFEEKDECNSVGFKWDWDWIGWDENLWAGAC